MSESWSVRVMRPDEWPAARAVAIDAFDDDPEIARLLDLQHASWSWRDEFAFVALDAHEQIVGMVLYNPAFVDAADRVVDVLVLSPLGVLRSHQRQGVGKVVVAQSLAALRDRPERLVFLEGVPAYYPKLGFLSASSLGFTPPSTRIPDRAFMVYPLHEPDPSVKGALVYPDVFWRADAVGLRQ